MDLVTSQFISQSLHFGLYLFATLACIAASWLYLDAWVERHQLIEFLKGAGLILLAAGFLITGTVWGNPGLLDLIATILKLAGYTCISIGHIIEPIQPRPKTTGYTPYAALSLAGTFTISLMTTLPLAALATALLYWRRGITGLERHLIPLGFAFSALTLSEAFALSRLWQTSDNPVLQSLATPPFGTLWILQHVTLLAGTLLMIRWVWRYLAKRLLSELFLTIITLTFSLTLIATISITMLLLGNIKRDTLANLQTATKVLDYAIDGKTAATEAQSNLLAESPTIADAIISRDHARLFTLTNTTLIRKQLADAIITDSSGVVLARGSDPGRYGDSLSGDATVRRALAGAGTSSLISRSGALAPSLMIATATPIQASGHIIGTAITSLALDSTFVDSLKHKTGLESTIYSGTTRAATTLTGSDSTTRSIGIKETNASVLSATYDKGQTWQGTTTITGKSYLAAYLALKNVDHTIIGMLFVGQPQVAILATATNATRLVFIGSAICILIVMPLVYLTARRIADELH